MRRHTYGISIHLHLSTVAGSEESGSDKLSPKVSSTVCGTPRFMAPEVRET